ncbi:MAG: peptidase [Thermoleophilia bacterium]|nr:peptidase [Thermoleophilia bacterium]
MQLASPSTLGEHVQRWAWLRVAPDVSLADLRATAPGETRRGEAFSRMRTATNAGVEAIGAQLREALAAAGLANARVEVRDRLWIDGSAIFRIDVPAGIADAARAVDELLVRTGGRVLDGDDLPPAARGTAAVRAVDAGGASRREESAPQWFSEDLGFGTARRTGLTGDGVRLAVVDSGVDASHAHLAAALGRGRVHDRFESIAVRSGHGTFVAGIVAGSETGLAPGVDLISSRTYGAEFADHAGRGEAARFTQRANAIRALQDAVAPDDGSRGADVLVTSWGILDAPGVPLPDYDRTMATIAAAGAVVVAAAGNDGAREGGGTIAVPAQLPDVIAAGGVDRAYRWHPRASAGPSPRTGMSKPDIAAPVVDIRSTSLGGRIADTTGNPDGGFAGTSAAAPIVASLIALLTQAVHDRGQASPDVDEVRMALPLLARDVDRPGVDDRTGLGVIDAHRIEAAADRLVAHRRAQAAR